MINKEEKMNEMELLVKQLINDSEEVVNKARLDLMKAHSVLKALSQPAIAKWVKIYDKIPQTLDIKGRARDAEAEK